MTVRRKLFLAIASFIVALSAIYILITISVVNGILKHINIADRSDDITAVSEQLLHYYTQNNHSWEGIEPSIADPTNKLAAGGISLMLISNDRDPLLRIGDTPYKNVTRLGINNNITMDGVKIATLYYYEPEAANVRIIQLGVSSSVTVILLIFAVVLIMISLLVAYWITRKFTAPLRTLLPALSRLGKGEFGTQAPIVSHDEYGIVAQTFNKMSLQLQQTEEARRNLVADVAHELRTPLTILQGRMDLIQQSGRMIEPEALLPLQDELIRLTRLVDDLHQLSLAESKKLSLELENGSVAKLLDRIIERIRDNAEDRGITIIYNNYAEATEIRMDANRLMQVFLNLLTNALRHTPEGGTITIVIKHAADAISGDELLEVSIADTGNGIAPEHLPHIFNRFYRSDEARARHNGGMGLGLAIAKEFVLAHGGTIEANSSIGQGTTFTIRLPLGASDD